MDYQVYIQQGNEHFGTEGSTIYIGEKPIKLRNDYIINRIHDKNMLVPTQLISSVLENLYLVWGEALAEGSAIQIKVGNDVIARIKPDISIKGGNINLKRAKELDPTVTEITVENATELVQKAGVQLKIKIEVMPKFAELVKTFHPTLESSGTVIVKDKVLKTVATEEETPDNTSSQVVDTSTGTVDTSTGSNNNGGDDIPAGNG